MNSTSTLQYNLSGTTMWLCLLLCGFSACQKPSSAKLPDASVSSKSATQHLGYRAYKSTAESFNLKVEIGSVKLEDIETSSRYFFQDSIRIEVDLPQKKSHVLVRAKSGGSKSPFSEVILAGCLWECEDGTEIETDTLIWDRNSAEYPIQMPFDVQIVSPRQIITGTSLGGDLLLQGFSIDRVLGVVNLDSLGGNMLPH